MDYISLQAIFSLLFIHFAADFVFQSDKMAQNKSHSLYYLALHSLTYGVFFIYFGLKFVAVTTLLHFCIDFVTSKINKKLWEKGQVHYFFVSVGFDQMLHMMCLVYTFLRLA